MSFDLVCDKFCVITRDFKIWLLRDFILEKSENFYVEVEDFVQNLFC